MNAELVKGSSGVLATSPIKTEVAGKELSKSAEVLKPGHTSPDLNLIHGNAKPPRIESFAGVEIGEGLPTQVQILPSAPKQIVKHIYV